MPSKRLFVLVSSGPNETTKNRQTKLQRWCLGVDSGSSRLSACMRKNSPGRPKHSASAGLSSTAGQPRTGVVAKTACRPAQPLLSNREINDCFIGRGTNVVLCICFRQWDETMRWGREGAKARKKQHEGGRDPKTRWWYVGPTRISLVDLAPPAVLLPCLWSGLCWVAAPIHTIDPRWSLHVLYVFVCSRIPGKKKSRWNN